MFESILKFLAPLLTSVLSSAASAGINQLMAPKQDKPQQQQAPARGAGLSPNAPPGVAGSGTTTNPQGSMNFGGGYTGAPDTRDMAPGIQSSLPSSGFQTMGYPSMDQRKLAMGLKGTGGFSGV